MTWEQLELPGMPVMESLRHDSPEPEYDQDPPREDDMLSVEIKINDEELYRAEAYLQGGDLGGLCTYKIVINDQDAGVVTHDRTDLAWVLAGLILARFPTPEKTLQQEGGARTAFGPRRYNLLDLVRKQDARGWAMTEEAAASAKLALEEDR